MEIYKMYQTLSPPNRGVYEDENNNKTLILSSKFRGQRSKTNLLDDYINHFRPPIMIMLIGIPASGKSYIADYLKNKNTVVHSSDTLRQELYGDENTQEHNADLFVELHRRIKNDLIGGKDVVYDATNISKKRRTAFIEELKNISCEKVCICVMTPYELCLKYNSLRERKVPEEVIKRMYMNWNPPSLAEGFNEIYYYYNYGEDEKAIKYRYKLTTLFEGDCGIDNFPQENKHHSLTLGEHCKRAMDYTINKFPSEKLLHIAALLHDNGKVFTKTKTNSKGIDDGDCHYYQHHCVGAYESLFFTKEMGLSTTDRTYIANLIYFHMHPYTSWKQSARAEIRDRLKIGEKFYNDVIKLHEADDAAH